MYRLSKSVPRGYEYLGREYFAKKGRNANVMQDLPPAPYLRQEKQYINVSPIRSKKMLVEARTYKSPISEREKSLITQTKFENFFVNITNIEKKSKIINSKQIKKCKENIRKMKIKKTTY